MRSRICSRHGPYSAKYERELGLILKVYLRARRPRRSRDYMVRIYFKVEKKDSVGPEKARLAQIIKQIREEIRRKRMLKKRPKKYSSKYGFKGHTYRAPN